MSEQFVIAILGLVSTLLTVVIVPLLVRLNHRIRKLEKRDRLSWLYIQSLIVHANTHAPGVPLPEPPEGWLDDTE